MAEEVHVVTAFLRHAGSVLLLRRGEGVGSYRGRWAAVSGYLEEPDALAQAVREVEEETGIDRADLRLVRAATPPADVPMFSHDGRRIVFASNRNPQKPRATDIFIADWVE